MQVSSNSGVSAVRKESFHGGVSGDEGVPLRSGLVDGEEHGGAQELGD